MFISINHIPVAHGREGDFEKLFQSRERAVEDQPGFISLDVLKPGRVMSMGEGARPEDTSNEYQVLTRWQDEASFKNWVASDAFKGSHSKEVDKTIFAASSYMTLHHVVEGTSATAPRSLISK